MKLSRPITATFIFYALGLLAACAEPSSLYNKADSNISSRPALKMHMTDAPNKELLSVFVNVHHVELWVEGRGHAARIITSQGLGSFDLLKLQNGALLPLNSLSLPTDILVKKIRIVLEETGHSAIKSDGSVCQMKTPSAQKSGLKINLAEPIILQKNSGYTVVIDFDAKKSVVQQGNGGCLLKPVLNIKKIIRHDIDDSINYILGDEINNENEIPPGENLIGARDSDNTSDENNGGFDYSDPSTWPPEMTPEEYNALF